MTFGPPNPLLNGNELFQIAQDNGAKKRRLEPGTPAFHRKSKAKAQLERFALEKNPGSRRGGINVFKGRRAPKRHGATPAGVQAGIKMTPLFRLADCPVCHVTVQALYPASLENIAANATPSAAGVR